MANDIYSTAHSGLSKLVSPRVASRVLETALRKRKLSSDTVTVKEMKSLLRGPVLRDLTGILPKSGLEHSLQLISKSVVHLATVPTLVEAFASPEPWDDTPPLSVASTSAPAFELEEGDQVLNEVVGVFEESKPPPQKRQPKVEITKTGETPLQLEDDAETTDSPVVEDESTRVFPQANPDTADKEAGLDTQNDWNSQEGVNAREDLETELLHDEKVHHEQSNTSSLGEHPSFEDEHEPHLSKASADTDPYATLIDTPIAQAPFDSAVAGPASSVDDKVPLPLDSLAVAPSAHQDADELQTDTRAQTVRQAENQSGGLGNVSDDELEKVILQFAQLDHVRMVAALAANGTVSCSRGDGFDLDTLSRLGTMGLTLLSRSGELRSYYLAFKEGQLFFFPLQGYTVCIIGTTELNLGLVFATLQKLEEDE